MKTPFRSKIKQRRTVPLVSKNLPHQDDHRRGRVALESYPGRHHGRRLGRQSDLGISAGQFVPYVLGRPMLSGQCPRLLLILKFVSQPGSRGWQADQRVTLALKLQFCDIRFAVVFPTPFSARGVLLNEHRQDLSTSFWIGPGIRRSWGLAAALRLFRCWPYFRTSYSNATRDCSHRSTLCNFLRCEDL
jgi:hypothetical protein